MLRHPLVFWNFGTFHDLLALPDTGEGQVPKIVVNDMLKVSAYNMHFLGGLHVRLEPVSKIRRIKSLSNLSNLSKLSTFITYTRFFNSISRSTSSSVTGGNFGRYCPMHLPTPS